MMERASAAARALAQRARSGFTLGNGPLVLLYHRVNRAGVDPWSLAVTSENFSEQMAALRHRGADVVPLARIAQAVRDRDGGFLTARRGRPRRVAITFDDGYADNLYAARPVLDRFEMSATVFVVPHNIENSRPFWVDLLGELLLGGGSRCLPPRLQLELCGEPIRLTLTGARGAPAPDGAAPDWRAWERPRNPNQAAYQALYSLLVRQPPASRDQALGALCESVGVSAAELSARCSEARPMTRDEVRRLRQGGRIEIGAHTVNHPCLAALPPGDQRAEVEAGRIRAEALAGGPVGAFAYPYGRPRLDYTDETVRVVREAGFECACANFCGAAGRWSDPFALPRVQVQDWGGDEFVRRLGL